MAKWQKVITSGSSAELAHVTASGGFRTTGTASFGDITGTVSTATQAKIDHDSLLNFVANEHIDHSGVSVIAGTGLTGGGTIAANRTLNVIGGDGITANANDIAITAAQTTITSILATDLVIGEDAQTKIDFETANEIHLDANNNQIVNIRAGGIVVTGDITASAGISASQFNTNYGPAAALGPGTGSFGHVTASFGGDGSRLINVTATAIDIDGLSALGGTGLHQSQDHFMFSDNGTEKKITFSNLEDAIFGNVSGDATIAAGGALTIANTAVETGMLADDAVDADKLAANAVVNASVASSAAIAYSKLAAMTSARILVGNGSNVATVVAVSGDATLANNGAVTLAAAQTNVNSILATDLVLGEDSQTKIDFETANEIHLDANNNQIVNVRAGGIVVTGDITASAGISASQFNTNYGPAVALGPGTGSFGHVTASFGGDGSRLINVAAASVDIDGLSALGGTGLHQSQDHFMFSDNGTEKKITFSNLEDAIFGNVSGDATIAAGGALTIAANAVEGSMLNSNVAGTGLTVAGNNIDIEASQTAITSILATDLVLGEDSQTKIDFETANEIHLDANNAQVVNVRAGGIVVTGDVTASAGISASGFTTPLGTVTAFSGAFSSISASGNTFATIATATQGTIDHDSLANFVANEHIDHSGVSVVAGTGLTGGGTIAANRTLNVIGGDGITANANDIAVTAAQTTITSIFATDLKMGEDDQTKIDFETANEIHLDANNNQIVNIRAGGIVVTGDITASAGISASQFNTNYGPAAALGPGTGSFGHVTASFGGDGSRLINVAAASVDIDGLSALGGTGLHQSQDHFMFSDNGTEKKITFSNLEDAIFGNVSGDATIAAGGALTIGAGTVEHSMLNDNIISGQGAMTAVAQADLLMIDDGPGTVKKITFSHFEDEIFGNLSGDATVAAGGAVTLAAAQTNVNSILATDLVLGEDAQTKIDFETANEIHLDTNNNQIANIRAGGIEVTGQITASSGISASHFQTSFAPAAALKPGTGSFGRVTASFAGDGADLINVTAASIGLTDGRIFVGNDSNVATAVAVSGDITINSSGVVTLGTVGANHVTEISNLTAGEGAQLENINSVTISNTQWGYVGAMDQAVQTDSNVQFNNLNVDGNLVVAGTASFEETANLNVKDRFISLASGSTAGGDGGIVVNQALGNVPSGSAFGYEAGTADRWAVQANFVPTGSAMVPDAYMGIVTFNTNAPTGNPQYGGANYGYGNIHVDTDDGEIYIFA